MAITDWEGVTAVVCLCRRADYLAIGGFCEDYIYGYEGVDLCLELTLGLGRPTFR